MSSAVVAIVAFALSTVSSSKLGVFVSNDDPQAILAACPRLAVFPIPSNNANIASVMSAYKLACTGGKVIAQVGGRGLVIDTSTEANLGPVWLSSVNTVNAACSSCVDAVEGPTESVETLLGGVLPGFWADFAQRMAGAGFQPIVGGLAPGLPVDGGSPNDAFCATATAVRARMGTSFAWSYHARSPSFANDVATASGVTFAYRQIAADCATALTGIQLFLSEVGPTGAWQPADGAALAPLDAQLTLDTRVQGAALFEASTGTSSLAPVATAFKTELAIPSPADGGAPDGGADGGGGGPGGVAQGGPPVGGDLNPTGPKSGCSTGGPAFLILALSPALFFLRRRAR